MYAVIIGGRGGDFGVAIERYVQADMLSSKRYRYLQLSVGTRYDSATCNMPHIVGRCVCAVGGGGMHFGAITWAILKDNSAINLHYAN